MSFLRAAPFALLIVFLLAALPASASEPVIGNILEIEGTATLLSADGSVTPLGIDSPLHAGDTVTTGPQSRAFILFIDDTQMVLSENTHFRVDEYVLNEEDSSDNKGVYSVLQGTFYYVSGLIAKRDNPDVTVNTRFGSIGIRGTQFWGGDIDGSNGVLVAEGAVIFKNRAGESRLAAGEGTMVKDAATAPDKPVLWKEEKIARAKKTVFLRRQQDVDHRIVRKRAEHRAMRGAYREKMMSRFKKLREFRRDNEGLRNRDQKRDTPVPRQWLRRQQ